MAAISLLNPKAELARLLEALSINVSAAKGIQEVMKSNLGPKGTMKMLVSGAGDIKITKDGNTLLHEMQIRNPTASFIARASTAIDDINGDGTTSTVILIGELLKQAEVFISDGLHPRIISEGYEIASKKVLEVLDDIKVNIDINRDTLLDISRTSIYTKVNHDIANILSEICVDAVLLVSKNDFKEIDLHMIEIMEMKHKSATETTLVKGIVLDHGARHSEMPVSVTNAYILTCNVGMEYEKTEVNSGFFYKTTEEREKLIEAERDFINKRVTKIIELKKKLCDGTDKHFVVINQKGIDPLSLEMFAKEGIIAIRRAKSRNMERLPLACGGVSMNTVDDLSEEHLGFAGSVYEYVLGEDKFTFIEECKNPQSATILIKGPNKHTLMQIKDAVHDGLRAVKNAIQDQCLVPGAGAFEIIACKELQRYKESIPGKAKLGVQAFAEALLIIPKVLAINSGFDVQDSIVKLMDDSKNELGLIVGLDVNTGNSIKPTDAGIYDNYQVKKQMISSSTVIASNLILVDEIMRAGLSSLKG